VGAVDRAVQSEARKERYRAALQVINRPGVDPTTSEQDARDALLLLGLVAAWVTADEWALLLAVGVSYRYEEIAAGSRQTAGSLRICVFRLRRLLARRLGMPLRC
jgi:hypothetical protein